MVWYVQDLICTGHLPLTIPARFLDNLISAMISRQQEQSKTPGLQSPRHIDFWAPVGRWAPSPQFWGPCWILGKIMHLHYDSGSRGFPTDISISCCTPTPSCHPARQGEIVMTLRYTVCIILHHLYIHTLHTYIHICIYIYTLLIRLIRLILLVAQRGVNPLYIYLADNPTQLWKVTIFHS